MPSRFCTTLREGIAAQKKLDELGMEARPVLSLNEMKAAAKNAKDGESPSEALHEQSADGVIAWDDLTGDILDPKLMAKARKDSPRTDSHLRCCQAALSRHETDGDFENPMGTENQM